jgi:hypothetical protein
MGFFFFFTNRKPRPFEHKPIYFDPQKEILKSSTEEGEGREQSTIKGRFIEGTTHLKRKRKKK